MGGRWGVYVCNCVCGRLVCLSRSQCKSGSSGWEMDGSDGFDGSDGSDGSARVRTAGLLPPWFTCLYTCILGKYFIQPFFTYTYLTYLHTYPPEVVTSGVFVTKSIHPYIGIYGKQTTYIHMYILIDKLEQMFFSDNLFI